MAKNLLIVESPAKAKTIEKILGSDFEVKSCFGHIRDLEKGDMGIDMANNFMPNYKISDEKTKVVSDLRASAKKSQEVWLATDEDREGEAISWHLCEVLKLNPETTKRIVFHEITKSAIVKAVENPRTVNMNLVNAQQARRVLDRIVGFELSPVLWRKVARSNSLSAGRVQSVTVRLIVEREREINNFTSISNYKVEALFNANDINSRKVNFKAELSSRIDEKKSAKALVEKCVGATYKVEDVQVRPTKRTPSAPFTTSTLQQEASRKIGYGVSRTMQVAQRLYEQGHITYMRTDAVSLSETARTDIKNQITTSYGPQYHYNRVFKNKNESAQEAHEAIRPTNMGVKQIADMDLQRLYDLIWKRTMASQMSDAELEKTTATIGISTTSEKLKANGEVIKFDGFLKLYMEGKDDEETNEDEGDDSMLPPLSVGQMLDLNELKATERFSRALPRYTEASLVKKLEELGIGRPSTYAPTISTVQTRNYVERKDKEGVQRNFNIITLKDDKVSESILSENTGAEKSKLFPTDLGALVTDFLKQHFTEVMDYQFTANVEQQFDEIAKGKVVWNKMIKDFYTPFHANVENTMETAERASGERDLGLDPETGKKIIARMGRYGPMVQLGDSADEVDKARFAKLKANQSIETINLAEALELFKLPKDIGEYEGVAMSVAIGRFGPYIKYGEAFVSIPKGEEPLDITTERAIQIIKEKNEADAPIAMYKNLPVTKGKGRFGPFIKYEGMFINIPRAYDFDTINSAECAELIEKKLEKEGNRFIHQFTAEKFTVENGRWGPFIKFNKKMLKINRKPDGEKYTSEEVALMGLEDFKKMIIEQVPTAFAVKAKKAAPPRKKAATKK
jgi:DNA topoisomerase-1